MKVMSAFLKEAEQKQQQVQNSDQWKQERIPVIVTQKWINEKYFFVPIKKKSSLFEAKYVILYFGIYSTHICNT